MGHSQDIQDEWPQLQSWFSGLCSSTRGSPSRSSLILNESVPLKDGHVNQKQEVFPWETLKLCLSSAPGLMGWS